MKSDKKTYGLSIIVVLMYFAMFKINNKLLLDFINHKLLKQTGQHTSSSLRKEGFKIEFKKKNKTENYIAQIK